MSEVLAEVRAKIAAEYNTMRVIESDCERDPHYVYKSNRRSIVALQQELQRLEANRIDGPAKKAMLARRIEVLELEIVALQNRDKLIKLLKMQHEVNELNGQDSDADAALATFMMEVDNVRERLREIAGLINAYRHEMIVLTRAISGKTVEREEQIKSIIKRRLDEYWQFLENRRDPYTLICAARERVQLLRVDEDKAHKYSRVDELQEAMALVNRLMDELGPARTKHALGQS